MRARRGVGGVVAAACATIVCVVASTPTAGRLHAADPVASALVEINPGSGLGASTWASGSIIVSNTGSSGAASIASVSIDLSGALVPDAVFDPLGDAGDTVARCVVVSDEGGTGYATPTDPCRDPFSGPHEDEPGVVGKGFDRLRLEFGDFGPSESFSFGVDIDPTTVQGITGSGGAASISGLELTGAEITVTFTDGQVLVNDLVGRGGGGGSATATLNAATRAAPDIDLDGVVAAPTVFANASKVALVPAAGPRTVRVRGPVGAEVDLLIAEATLANPSGFDIDPFESDKVGAIAGRTATIGADGSATFVVDIADSDVLYTFVATIDDGAAGRTSDILIVTRVRPSFGSSGLAGETSHNPTSLQFGPDDRLYVAQQNGIVRAYTIERNGRDDYAVVDTEVIRLIRSSTPNHDDDGSGNDLDRRQVTGLLVTGTADTPVLYVSSSDPRISVGEDSGLDTNSGVISRLTRRAGGWDKVDIVRGLPRSEENHSTNGMALDEASNTLFVMQGGNTNKGAPGNNLSGSTEVYLSAALLSVDLDAIDAIATFVDPRNGATVGYDLRTLDDPTRPNITNTDPAFPYPVGHPMFDHAIDVGDPFGGNNGLNQAIPEPDGPVQIHSTGYRNAYDVVLTSRGRLYTVDNGPNTNWGGTPTTFDSADDPIDQGAGPVALGPGDYCTNGFNEANSAGHGDSLMLIESPGFYAGHPAPIRAFPGRAGVRSYRQQVAGGWVLDRDEDFFDLLPPDISPDSFPDRPQECDYLADDPAARLDVVATSTNGIAEYTSSRFGGQMQGNLLAASFDGKIRSYRLSTAGDELVEKVELFGGFGSQPLDVVAQGDDDVFPGTVWAATYGANGITVFEPAIVGNCSGLAEPGLDQDSDGFTDDDEVLNGTDPCSGGDRPNDHDDDGVSDLADPDDDEDGIADVDDPFALDPDNGLTTTIPVLRPFENGDPGTGLFGLGLTGLMTNGVDTYLQQFDPATLAAGGNGGELGIEVVTAGDALEGDNSQDNAFQFGVAVDTRSDPFVVTTEVVAPVFGGEAPAGAQSAGLQIGAGDQDEYVKVVIAANGGAGGVLVVRESAARATPQMFHRSAVGADVTAARSRVTLSIVVDPRASTAHPRVRVDDGPIVELGEPVPIPASWLDPNDDRGLAVGVISTSSGATPFATLFASLDVEYLADVDTDPPDVGPGDPDAPGDGEANRRIEGAAVVTAPAVRIDQRDVSGR